MWITPTLTLLSLFTLLTKNEKKSILSFKIELFYEYFEKAENNKVGVGDNYLRQAEAVRAIAIASNSSSDFLVLSIFISIFTIFITCSLFAFP